MSKRKPRPKTVSGAATPAVAQPDIEPDRPWLLWIAFVGIFIVTFIAYAPAIPGDFIWDDDGHVTRPEMASLRGLWRIWFDLKATQQYYPLLHSAFWVQYHIWGETPGVSPPGYHVVNIFMHATVACLFGLLLRRLKIPGAILAAFIFALHPVCVESVAWITELKNTLSTTFYLCAALAYLRFNEKRSAGFYLLATLLFICGLLSKSVTATLPAALLVIFWWQHGKLSLKCDVLPLVPWFIIGAAAGLFTAWVERELIGAKGQDFQLSLAARVLVAGRATCFYLGKLIWPSNLIFIYERWDVDPKVWWQWIFPIAAAGLLAALWLIRKRSRAPLAAILLFTGTLFPVLGFFNVYPFIFSFVADHFQYQASMGIIGFAAAEITVLVSRLRGTYFKLGWICAGTMVFLLGTLTFRQSTMYTDILQLYQTTIDRNPRCWMAHMNIGTLLMADPEMTDAAKYHLQEAIKYNPALEFARLNLGAMYEREGYFQDAIDQWKRVIEIARAGPDAYTNLALLYATCPDPQYRNLPEAVRLATLATELSHGNDAQAWTVLGAAYAESGRYSDAITSAEKAIVLAREANNDEMVKTIEAHLSHYHEVLTSPATKPATTQ